MESEEYRIAKLTEAERQALRLWVEDLSAKQVGLRLGISERTVYQRVARARDRLGVDTPMQAARLLAVSEGRPVHTEIAHQEPHIAVQPAAQSGFLRLLVPEVSGSTLNDLTIPHRALIILSRAALVLLLLVGVAALLHELNWIMGRSAQPPPHPST